MATTLAEFRTRARERADQEGSQFITDTELDTYVNASAAELYDILVSRFVDYYLESFVYTVASGSDVIPLPTNFYKLRGLDVSGGGGRWLTVSAYNFAQRNDDTADLRIINRAAQRIRHRVQAGSVKLIPADQAVGNYQVWYVPRMPTLVATTDAFDGINGWEEYVVVDAAIKMMQKEESDTSALERQKAALLKRIETMAAERNVGEPERLIGPRGSSDGWGW